MCPPTTKRSHPPTCGIGSCRRRRSSAFTSLSFACTLFRLVCRTTVNPPIPLLPADVRDAEDIKRLRLPLPDAPPALGRVRTELQQPRLLGVQRQTKPRKSLAQLGQEPLGLPPVLKSHDDVVRVPHDHHITAGVRPPPPPDPEIEHVVQI